MFILSTIIAQRIRARLNRKLMLSSHGFRLKIRQLSKKLDPFRLLHVNATGHLWLPPSFLNRRNTHFYFVLSCWVPYCLGCKTQVRLLDNFLIYSLIINWFPYSYYRRCVVLKHVVVVGTSVLLIPIALILLAIDIDTYWLYIFTSIVVSSCVLPISLAITWHRLVLSYY